MKEEKKNKEEIDLEEDSLGNSGENNKKRKHKNSLYIEFALFLILGILIGITLKTEAIKKLTIGYNDYQMNIKKSDYDINKLQVDLAQKVATQANAANQQNQPQNAQNQGSPTDQSQSGGAAAAPGQNNPNQ